MELWLGVAALVVSIALWLFNPHPLRRRLGLEPRPEVPPIFARDADLTNLLQHSEIAPLLPSDLADSIGWQLETRTETARANGWRLFETRDGRRVACQMPGERGGTNVLMWKPGHGPAEKPKGRILV